MRTITHITSDTLTNHHTAKIFEYPPISAHKITSEMVVFVCDVFERGRGGEKKRSGEGLYRKMWCEQMSADEKRANDGKHKKFK